MGLAIVTVAKGQDRTDKALSALIDTVDRFIQNSGGAGTMPQAT